MKYFEELMLSEILLGIEFLAGLVAVFYFFRLKNSYWKWFCVYLVFIFVQELFWFPKFSFFGITKPEFTKVFDMDKQDYYAYWGIPVQYLFFFWLFALRSLKNKKLFIGFSLIYIATYILIKKIFGTELHIVYESNLATGTLLLSILVVLEFRRQIRTDEIFNFTRSKMFYITVGMILFYIGTFPFFALYETLIEDDNVKLWNGYFLYFKISNCIMYLLFIASFLWGKQHQNS